MSVFPMNTSRAALKQGAGPIIARALRSCLILSLLTLLFSSGASAAFSRSEWIQKNRALGGAFATCAEDICSYEECKERVMTRVQASGAEIKDKGAWGSALATCTPHEQVMNQCLAEHTPEKKEIPTKEAWCTSGDDSRVKMIWGEMDRRVAEIGDLKLRILKIQKRRKAALAEFEALDAQVRLEKAAFEGDVKAAKAASKNNDIDRVKYYKQKWTPAKINEINGRIRKRNELKKAKNSLYEEHKALYDERMAKIKQFQAIKDAYNSRDCSRAWQLIHQ